MVSPLAAATQGLISDGLHRPLRVSVQGLLIFALVPVGGRDSGSFGEDQEEEHGGRSRRRRRQQQQEDEIFVIINAFLATQ